MALTTFTSGQVLTAAQLNAVQANDYNQTVSTRTASTTLVAADKGTRVVMNAAGATTITVNTSVFSAGDTLVIQNIGAGVTTVTAGTATVSSAGSLAIPQNGSGTLYFTSAGVSIFYPSAGPAAVSPIVQVVFESYAVETTTTSTSYVTSGLTATITPTLNTSKVLVMATCVVENGASQNAFATVFRGTVADTNLYGATGFLAIQEDSANRLGGGAGNFLDSPATTSATTYTLAFKGSGANTTFIQAENTTSTLVLMEIKV
jgi:hypothetical protein